MIGERIKRARAAAGLSMQALGKQVGVSANMIKKYEHNVSMPGSAVLIKLGKALGVRTEYFFRPINVNLSGVEYRKRSNTPAAVLKADRSGCIGSGRAFGRNWRTYGLPSRCRHSVVSAACRSALVPWKR